MRLVPLSVRRGVREPLTFVPGVPAHLKVQLIEWIEPFFLTRDFMGVNPRTENIDGAITLLQWPIAKRDELARLNALFDYMVADDDRFLDAIDLTLKAASERARDTLDDLLEQGMSTYRVTVTEPYQLEDRLTATARDAITDAASPRDAAADHIADAWRSAYGRKRDATAAWNSAVKAVEVLLHPIVVPRNAKATLGSMAAVLRNKPEDWRFAIAANDNDTTARPFLRALELVGYEPGRHGTDPDRATLMQARVVVLQSVTIVEWLRSGALTRAS